MSCRKEDSEGFLHQMVTELCSLLENSQLSFLIRDQGMCVLSMFVKVPPHFTSQAWRTRTGRIRLGMVGQLVGALFMKASCILCSFLLLMRCATIILSSRVPSLGSPNFFGVSVSLGEFLDVFFLNWPKIDLQILNFFGIWACHVILLESIVRVRFNIPFSSSSSSSNLFVLRRYSKIVKISIYCKNIKCNNNKSYK